MFGKKKNEAEKVIVRIDKEDVRVVRNFKDWLQSVHDMSVSPLSQGEKRAKLNEYINALNDTLYLVYFPQILSIIQKSKENCEPFKNSQEQVNTILSLYPRFKEQEELILLYIKERRKKYGLEV